MNTERTIYRTTGQLGTSFSYSTATCNHYQHTTCPYVYQCMCIVLHVYSFSAASAWWDTGTLLVSMRLPFSQKEWKGPDDDWPSNTSQLTLLEAFLLGCNCNSNLLSDSEFHFEAHELLGVQRIHCTKFSFNLTFLWDTTQSELETFSIFPLLALLLIAKP